MELAVECDNEIVKTSNTKKGNPSMSDDMELITFLIIL